MVGQLNGQKEAKIASLLTPLFLNPRVLFIISSDFCHWGTRFRYTPYSPSLSIQGYITSLDKRGMELISQLSHMNFSNYLKETGNTICGRNPILLLLKIVEELGKTHYKIDFVEYQQSNQIISSSDSCVCYASGYLFHN
jgi:AmmeMemoRadiSam system protein B